MLVLDTEDIPPADRIDFYQAAVVGETGSCGLEHEPDANGHIAKRLEAWRFGPVAMYLNSGTGMRFWQSARHLRMDSWHTVSVLAQVSGRGRFVWNDHQQEATCDDLFLAAKSAGYWERTWFGQGSTLAFLIDAEHVALPESMIHTAVPLVAHSPITPLLLNHIRALHRDADRLEASPGADSLGDAAIALIRSLVASVGAARDTRRAVAEETRLVRVLAYIRAHITDPDLTPARIAAAHNISQRSLYRLCEEGGLSLEQWIIRRRLEGARRDLAAPEHAHRTIEAIARSWGFTNAAYFSRRFRQAYRLSPRAWRATGGTPKAPDVIDPQPDSDSTTIDPGLP